MIDNLSVVRIIDILIANKSISNDDIKVRLDMYFEKQLLTEETYNSYVETFESR